MYLNVSASHMSPTPSPPSIRQFLQLCPLYPTSINSLLSKTSSFGQTSRLFRNFLCLQLLISCTCTTANLSITSFNSSLSATLSSLPTIVHSLIGKISSFNQTSRSHAQDSHIVKCLHGTVRI